MVLALLICAAVLFTVHWTFAALVVVLAFLVGRGPIRFPSVVAVVVALTVTSLLFQDDPSTNVEDWIGAATANSILILVPWLIGRYVHDRLALGEARRRQVEQLEERRRTVAHEARLRERTLIAREIHDTVGHELSLIALRAGALEVGVGSDSSTASEAARQVRQAATRATEQLGDVVGLLGDGDSAPLRPVQDDVSDVVGRAADAGVDVTLAWTGDREPLSALVQHTVVRVVQEALTNATKHAPGAPVTVTIAATRDTIAVDVANEGAGSAEPIATSDGGHGLIGLAERVRLLGGSFSAEPSGQGFRLTAAVPRGGQMGFIDSADDLSPDDRSVLDAVDEKHSRERRSLVAAVLVPIAVVVVSTVATVGYFTYATMSSVLTPEEFATIHVGQSRDEVEEVLPPIEMLEPPSDRLDVPADADCLYYESEVSFFDRRDAYRICFADSAVVSTDVIEPDDGER